VRASCSLCREAVAVALARVSVGAKSAAPTVYCTSCRRQIA